MKAGVKVLAVPSARTDYLLINTKANATLGNPAFWEAARYLVDYNGIAKDLLRGQSQVHQAFLPVGFPGALTDTPFKLDVAKAKKILADAGIKTPFKIDFPVFNDQPFLSIAQSLQSSFGKAGIQLDIQPGVASEIYAKGRSGQVSNHPAVLDSGLFRSSFQCQRLCHQQGQFGQYRCQAGRLDHS